MNGRRLSLRETRRKVVFVGDGGDKARLTVDVVTDNHQSAIWKPNPKKKNSVKTRAQSCNFFLTCTLRRCVLDSILPPFPRVGRRCH